MLYSNNLREVILLIISLIFLAIGVASVFAELGYLYPWDVRDVIKTYWPIIIILIGFWVLFKRH